MRYLAKRVERICDELYRLRIVQRIPLTDLICKKGTYIRPEAADAATPPWTSFDSRTMHWYGPDEHYWFRTEFTVPKALNGKAMWLNVRTQIEGGTTAKTPAVFAVCEQRARAGHGHESP